MAHHHHKELQTLMEEKCWCVFHTSTVLKDICNIAQYTWPPDFVTKEQVKIKGASVPKIAVVPKYRFNPLRNRDEHRQKSIFYTPEHSPLIYLELVLILDKFFKSLI